MEIWESKKWNGNENEKIHTKAVKDFEGEKMDKKSSEYIFTFYRLFQ